MVNNFGTNISILVSWLFRVFNLVTCGLFFLVQSTLNAACPSVTLCMSHCSKYNSQPKEFPLAFTSIITLIIPTLLQLKPEP